MAAFLYDEMVRVSEDAAGGNGARGREPVSERERSALHGRWSTHIPLALVVVSLLLLAIVPFLAERRIRALRDDIADTVEPARQLATQIQAALALQTAAARGFVLTGDQAFAERHRQAQAARVRAETHLRPIARQLGARAPDEVGAFSEQLRPADAILDSLFDGDLSREEYRARLDEQQVRLEHAVAGAARLDETFRALAKERQARMEAAERRSVVFILLLVLLALVAALLVARLGRNYRMLALRLDRSEARYRLIAESERRARDDAETARAAAELRRSELERVTESRARLLRGFTHDVKNPLGAADGILALLEDGIVGELTPAQEQNVGRTRRAIRTALGLIHSLLELAQAEAGRLTIRRAATDMRAIAEEVGEEFRPQAENAGLSLALDTSLHVPILESDPERARQILQNLISNAIKYTPRGGHVTVLVAARQSDPASSPGEWVVTDVSDTGRGIAPDKQDKLFLEFTRFDPEVAEGAGIGLAISQRIAEALGGVITVSSQIGAGTTFTLWLPLNGRERGESQ